MLGKNAYLHLREDQGFAVLSGGPVAVEVDNLSLADEVLLKQHTATLERVWERRGDDGPFWRRWLVLIGVEVTGMFVRDGQPHFQLPFGSWIRLDTVEGDSSVQDAADRAQIIGIYGDQDIRPRAPLRLMAAEPTLTWRMLKVDAFKLIKDSSTL